MQLNALIASLLKFVSELQRRKVLRIAAAYVVGAWIVLQVSLALQTAMSLSGQFSAAILALLVIGFFVTLVLAWFYEITPEGVKRTAPATGDAPLVKPQTTDLALAGALTLVVIVALVQLFTSSPPAPPTTAPTTTAETTPAKPEPPALGDKSIAVLPFANLSPDKEDAVFADGLTEEVLNALGQIRELRLVSRTSSFAFKGKNTALPEIARQLGIRHILEGSVRRDGEIIKVTAQLIDVTTDTRLWSKTFERTTESVFAVQDQIARAIANALDVEFAAADAKIGTPTSNIDAYRRFLEARELFRLRRRPEDLTDSVALYQRAIELDPKFAEAYSGLAVSYSANAVTNLREVDRFILLSRTAAEEAIRLKPSLAQPHAVLGTLARFKLDWESSHAHTSRALSLDPMDSLALYSRGAEQILTGYLAEASRTIAQARRVDPLYAFMQTAELQAAFAQGDDDACLEIAHKLARSGALTARTGHWYLAYHARLHGDHSQAEKHYRAWAKLRNGGPIEQVVAALKSRASVPAAVKAVREALDKDQGFSLLPFVIVGAPSELVDALNADVKQDNAVRVSAYLYLAWRFVDLEEVKPRFKEFARNAGLVDYWKKHGWPDRCRAKGEDDFECS